MWMHCTNLAILNKDKHVSFNRFLFRFWGQNLIRTWKSLSSQNLYQFSKLSSWENFFLFPWCASIPTGEILGSTCRDFKDIPWWPCCSLPSGHQHELWHHKPNSSNKKRGPFDPGFGKVLGSKLRRRSIYLMRTWGGLKSRAASTHPSSSFFLPLYLLPLGLFSCRGAFVREDANFLMLPSPLGAHSPLGRLQGCFAVPGSLASVCNITGWTKLSVCWRWMGQSGGCSFTTVRPFYIHQSILNFQE